MSDDNKEVRDIFWGELQSSKAVDRLIGKLTAAGFDLRRARSGLAGDGETVRAHIDGLKEAAARVEEDAENKTGPAKIALEDAWSGIQSLIADWEALSALPSPEAPHD